LLSLLQSLPTLLATAGLCRSSASYAERGRAANGWAAASLLQSILYVASCVERGRAANGWAAAGLLQSILYVASCVERGKARVKDGLEDAELAK
jgi:hypothetical protein